MSWKFPAPLLAGRRMCVALAACTVILVLAPVSRRLGAQSYARLDLGGLIQPGTDAERYARVLQLAGLVPLTPWSLQPFSPSVVRTLRPTKPHPWAARFSNTSALDSDGVRVLRTSARLIGNSALPVQIAAGPTWAGRGLTAELQAGATGHWGPLYAQAAPLAFVAQNLSFPLAPNGQTGNGQFADPRFPDNIDAPQRFGNGTYGQLAPGTSSLVLDGHGLVGGLSTAPQQWGPNREYPLVLGPNAGGFPMVFAGSSEPWNFWLFTGHGRLVYGELAQSAYAPANTFSTNHRFASGLVVVGQLRGVPGLEIGAGRFVDRPWGNFSASTLLRPFSGIVNINHSGVNESAENQNASVFARWALPAAKAEFYGEFYKEDYIGSLHSSTGDLVEQPDDLSSYAFGFQRLLVSNGTTIRVLRAEVVNGESAHGERLERGFTNAEPPYIHSVVVQGHTENGLILGAPEAYGGAAWTIGIDEYSPAGRRTLALTRQLRLDWLPAQASVYGDIHPEVLVGIRAESVRFVGDRDIGITVFPAVDLNRNLADHHDVFNLTVAFTARGWP